MAKLQIVFSFFFLKLILNKIIKNISAVFLLVLFLLPTAEQTIHAYKHSNDKHCNVVGEKHFHEKEHHCFLCDYTITSEMQAAKAFSATKIFHQPFSFSLFKNDFVEIESAKPHPARGPPVC